jgi:hypothetical protein
MLGFFSFTRADMISFCGTVRPAIIV